MERETIFLKDVLSTMRTLDSDGKAVNFSISFRTFNSNSKTGGKLKVYEKAKQVIKEENKNVITTNSLRYKPNKKSKVRRNPNHWDNKTRNIKVLPQGDIRKVHINNIITFNNKTVVY